MKNNTLLLNFKKVQWVIFALACIIYSNTIPNKWTFDDGLMIHQNHFVKRGISGIDSICRTDAFTGFYGRDINAVAGGRYRPLTPALFALEAELFAPIKKDYNQTAVKDNSGYELRDLSKNTWFPNILHFFNVLWYGLLCMILYRTLLLAFQLKWKEDPKSYFIAAITTLLFTVHPLHTEVVANAKTLDEIVTLLGAITSLYCVLKLWGLSQLTTSNKEKTKWLILSLVSFFLALLSKESAVTFVAVIPLTLWFFTQATSKDIFKLSVPFILPVALFLGIRSTVLHQPNKGEVPKDIMNDSFLLLNENAKYEPIFPGSDIKRIVEHNDNTFTQMPFSNKLATNMHTFGVYLKLLVAPYPLTIDYYPRHIVVKSFSDWSVILSLLVHLALIIIVCIHLRKKNLIAFGILYYFVTFSIFSNVFFPIGTNMAERFMFIPSIGFCLIIAYLFYLLQEKFSSQTSKLNLAFTAIVLLFSGLTFSRNFDWKDNYTLFSKDITVSKNSGKITLALASEYINKAIGIDENSKDDMDTEELAEKQLAIKNLSVENINRIKQAIPLLKNSLEIHPMNSSSWLVLGNAYYYLGLQETDNPKSKLDKLQIALNAYTEAYTYRGIGMDSIIQNYQAACFLDLGKLWGQQFGNIPVAIAYLEQAKQLTPEEPEVYLLLGTAYSMLNDFEKAIEYTKRSSTLRPNDIDTKQNLAVAYQLYAYNVVAKRSLLPLAEKLLLEVWSAKKKLPNTGIEKVNALLQTLDLLFKNATINGNLQKQKYYQSEILKLNPNAFNTSTN